MTFTLAQHLMSHFTQKKNRPVPSALERDLSWADFTGLLTNDTQRVFIQTNALHYGYIKLFPYIPFRPGNTNQIKQLNILFELSIVSNAI